MTDLFLQRAADIDGAYRFSLTRTWDDRLPVAAWLMLNPSTADAEVDDPTLRRVMHFSRANGCGSAVVVNLWPLRTPYPRDLWPTITGFDRDALNRNMQSIRAASDKAAIRIAAFGADAGRHHRAHVETAVHNFRPTLPEGSNLHGLHFRCLGSTSDGWPLHPLARGKFAIPNARKLNGWGLPR